MKIRTYDGSALEYIKKEIVPNLPKFESIVKYHKKIVDYLDSNPDFYIIRKTKDFKLRGHEYELDSKCFITADNEPALWYYTLCEIDTRELRLERNFKAAMKAKEIPLAYARSQIERSKWDWGENGYGRKTLDKQFSDGGWKHCHILQCSPRGIKPQTEDNLRVRMLRLLSPFNHFPFPSPRKYKMAKDWGENKDFINLYLTHLINDVFDEETKKEFENFLKLANSDLNTNYTQDFNISFSPRAGEIHNYEQYEDEKEIDKKTKQRVSLKTYISTEESFYSVQKGKKCESIDEFVEVLKNWAYFTDEEMISNYAIDHGQTKWIRTKYNGIELFLNGDSTREGIEKFISSYNNDSSLIVVLNKKKKNINKVEIEGVNHIVGLFLYTDKYYDKETKL